MKTNPLAGTGGRIAAAVIALVLIVISYTAAAALRAPETTRPAAAAPDPSSPDVRAFRFLNGELASPVLDAIMPLATDFDKWRTIVILIWCALVLFGKARGRWAALMLIPVIAASDQLASAVIKPLFERSRPCEVLGSVHLWYGPEGWITTPAEVMRSYKPSPAFPSSHAANITASMLFLGLVYRRALLPLLAIAVIVSFSRIYIGVHWPSDVLGGMALGALIAWAAYAAFTRVYRKASPASEPFTRSEPDTPPSE